MEPLISIITTYYNYERYVRELADSVLQQGYPNWEWIIVDDASQDNLYRGLGDVIPDPRIRIFKHQQNQGYSVAKNTALREARGDYFVMIDADDVLTPVSLQARYDALQQRPDKLWVHADALNYSVTGEIETNYIRWTRAKRQEWIDAGKDLEREYHHRMIHAQTVMVRRDFHEQLGLYDTALRFSSDNEMWRRAIRFGILPVYLPVPVAIYRAHDARMSRSEFKKKRIGRVKEYIKDVVERRFTLGLDSVYTERL